MGTKANKDKPEIFDRQKLLKALSVKFSVPIVDMNHIISSYESLMVEEMMDLKRVRISGRNGYYFESYFRVCRKRGLMNINMKGNQKDINTEFRYELKNVSDSSQKMRTEIKRSRVSSGNKFINKDF